MVWKKPDRPVILASQSPRRRDILTTMGFTFEVLRPGVDNETEFFSRYPLLEALVALAAAKAESVSNTQREALVVGADTIVSIDGAILGKPRDKLEADAMLQQLSGRTHTVHTSVALSCSACGFSAQAIESTAVLFRHLSKWEIDDYLVFDEYQDKAGSYAIQGRAMTFVERIEGCYFNVVGLPVRKTIDLFTAYANRKGESNV
jgi:septum formation protein